MAVIDPIGEQLVGIQMESRRRFQRSIIAVVAVLACELAAEPMGEPRAYTPDPGKYSFVVSGTHARLDQVFSPPRDFIRVSASDRSFAAWLRGLPLRSDRTQVLSYRGAKLNSPAAAIVAIDVGDRDLQQCADSAIRLHAEFLWSQGRSRELAYHFTSGDEVEFSHWLAGERIVVNGAKVRRVHGAPRANSRATLRDWLELVFRYAGTRSLHRDSEPIAPGQVMPGDFFVSPGSPGHAVMVVDVAEAADGRRLGLLGQGFMPAQDFHIIRGSGPKVVDGAWFLLPDAADGELRTPSWKPFHGSDARRFSPQ